METTIDMAFLGISWDGQAIRKLPKGGFQELGSPYLQHRYACIYTCLYIYIQKNIWGPKFGNPYMLVSKHERLYSKYVTECNRPPRRDP